MRLNATVPISGKLTIPYPVPGRNILFVKEYRPTRSKFRTIPHEGSEYNMGKRQKFHLLSKDCNRIQRFKQKLFVGNQARRTSSFPSNVEVLGKFTCGCFPFAH